MKTYQDEVGLSVADYIDRDDPDPALAFELATDDEEGAVKQAQAELHECLSIDEVDRLKITAKFVECDSGNWTHAGAMYEITIKGPDELVDKAAELWCDFREPAPPMTGGDNAIASERKADHPQMEG